MGRLLAIACKSKSHAPMDLLETAQVTRQAGVEGDYRGAAKGHEERQVTVLSREVWQLVCSELAAELPWHLRRANLLVEGVELPRQAGARLTIGGLELEVTMETAPCSRMDEYHQGLRQALTPDWRGGVCCRVMNDTQISVGDPVEV